MATIQVDYKKEKIVFQDQNKSLIGLIRVILGLNVLNSILFFLVFNNQRDILQWVWLVFAVLSVIAFYLSLTKLSFQSEFIFKEIKRVIKINGFGLFLALENGKYRKIFIPTDSEHAQKLMKHINGRS